MQRQEPHRESIPQRYDQWRAINALPGVSALTSPPIAPSPLGAYGASVSTNLPLHPPSAHGNQAQAPSTSFGQIGAAQAPSPMTPEQIDAWLRSLDTSFGGDDLNAFVEGMDWSSWSSGGADITTQPSGWLNTIWTATPQRQTRLVL